MRSKLSREKHGKHYSCALIRSDHGSS